MSGGHHGLHRIGDAAQWKCVYCGVRLFCQRCFPDYQSTHRLRAVTRDHAIPKSKGGRGPDNLVAACDPCNRDKADRLPHEPPPPKKVKPGCHLGKAPRGMRPRKGFPTLELAQAMCDVVEYRTGKTLKPWLCPHCNEWHVSLPRITNKSIIDA